jgi:spoIIIJ-associated protein
VAEDAHDHDAQSEPPAGLGGGEQREEARSARAEAEGSSAGAAKWAAMKELEQEYPGLTVEHVRFEVVEERSEAEGGPSSRVVAIADVARWRELERKFNWPSEPADRVREILRRVVASLGLRASVDVVDSEEGLVANVSGPELGLLIGKHGLTLDALQFVCAQAAFRGAEDRRQVIVDAAGYRERRESALRRQADRGAADALRFGRAVELDSMGSQERKVVHNYLKQRADVDTHSEGEEPFRRIVITPLRGGSAAG